MHVEKWANLADTWWSTLLRGAYWSNRWSSITGAVRSLSAIMLISQLARCILPNNRKISLEHTQYFLTSFLQLFWHEANQDFFYWQCMQSILLIISGNPLVAFVTTSMLWLLDLVLSNKLVKGVEEMLTAVNNIVRSSVDSKRYGVFSLPRLYMWTLCNSMN
jgi:hypothetical protein